MRVSLLLLGAATLFQHSYTTVHSQHMTCTNGRVFLADEQQPVLHALDADDGEVYDTDVSASGASVWLSSSGTVVSSSSTGVTQFLHTGILLEDHQDHKDVHKEFPFAYDYSVAGVGGSVASRTITESVGYMGLHYGSSAIFVKNADFQFTPNVHPHTITVPIAQQPTDQGIAVALSETRFLVSVANGFNVLDQNGSPTMNVTECSNYGGSGFSGNEWVHICGSHLLLMHHSNSILESTFIQDIGITQITNKAMNQQFIGYQPAMTHENVTTTNTLIRFRVDTVTRDNIVDSFNIYSYPLNDTSIHGLNPCVMAYEDSDHHHVIVLWPTGRMDVLDADFSEAWSLEAIIQVVPNNENALLTCDALLLSVGSDVVYINHQSSLYQVDLHDHDIQTTTLTFVPKSMAFWYDSHVLCEEGGHDHDHDHDHDHEHTSTAASTSTSSTSAVTATPTGPSSSAADDPSGTISSTPVYVNTASCHMSSSHVMSLVITMLVSAFAF